MLLKQLSQGMTFKYNNRDYQIEVLDIKFVKKEMRDEIYLFPSIGEL
jgi:hypothetical protein